MLLLNLPQHLTGNLLPNLLTDPFEVDGFVNAAECFRLCCESVVTVIDDHRRGSKLRSLPTEQARLTTAIPVALSACFRREA